MEENIFVLFLCFKYIVISNQEYDFKEGISDSSWQTCLKKTATYINSYYTGDIMSSENIRHEGLWRVKVVRHYEAIIEVEILNKNNE